jgi:predicted acylesterase/phospholipase RssA
MSSKVYRILSFDGGGMKGLFSAYFMKQFCRDAAIPGNKIYEYFDIIAGSSIGGIQGLAYASGFSPDDMIEMFLAQQNPLDDGSYNTGSIFYPAVSTWQKINTVLYGDQTWYQNTNLKALLNAKFGQSRMFQLKTNVLITSAQVYATQIPDVGADIKAYRPVLFSNMGFTGLEGQNYLVQDVALATSAAPIYFPAVNIPEVTTPNSKFIDGGTYQNNPCALEWALSNGLSPSTNRICVLSVGTGLGTIGLFNPVPVPPPETIQKHLNEFREFLLLQKNYTTEKAEEFVNSIIPNFENVYLLLDLISLGITGPQEAVNKQLELQSLYGSKINNKDLFYYRFNTIYNLNQDTELDCTTADFLNYMKTAAEAQYQKDALKIQGFIQKLNY